MPGKELVQSILRAVDVLELLASEPAGLALGDLCGRLGLKAPTVHNILRTLMARALVERHAAPVRYRLGPRLGEMACRLEDLAVDRRCEALLRGLVKDGVAEAAHLARQAAGELTVVLRIDASRPHLSERPAGRPLHPYGSCAGLVFQAFCERSQWVTFRRAHPFPVYGAPLWGTEAELDAEIERIRENGFCLRRDDGALRVGVPYLGRRSSLEGILGASRTVAETAEGAQTDDAGHTLASAVRECARRLSAMAGYAEEP